MLTKSDKKFIQDSVKDIITENNKSVKKTIDDAITINNEVLIKEIMDLFSATNERISQVEVKLGGKIDKALQQLKDHNDILDNHEHRLDKVEDKVFTATTNP
ncbi:MAG: hypothetical protein US11_C0009G0020 [Candidatus Roizmanbacteria bacterium GW2011_GWA2_36_23]|uniref:Uncharacterized protein n=1 Tax=Candidatus Roizmanbacteria bacterium GW2011_GWA2_36_23 TaxID=1618480 RepID=A0A0G0E3D6_9BACT|nr:MAG: hypothetical protein US11_C0009G0020 [Candidatus Roizmanbacteria bacterium GW2011_GWA2_36_23]